MKRSLLAEAHIRNSPLTAYRLGKAQRVPSESGPKDNGL